MTEARSLCRIDWKLGQALMPDHFLWQEDSLRREWEVRFSHQALPMWGVAALGWDDELLRAKGRLLITRLALVFSTGTLIDVPGNTRQAVFDLPPPRHEPIDIYVHLDSEPEIVKGEWTDKEGCFVELRLQKLRVAEQLLENPQPGFRLLRLVPVVDESKPGPARVPLGWKVDPGFTPALVTLGGFAPFAHARFLKLSRALERWKELLRRQAVENTLAVHKRVEAALYLRHCRLLDWEVRQLGALIDAAYPDGAAGGEGRERTPGVQAHPFELFRHLVSLYTDIFSYRAGPLATMAGAEPLACLYRHDELMACFGEVERAIEEELARPGAGSPEWAFAPLRPGSSIRVCNFPESLPLDAELYFLVQFEDDEREPGAASQAGLDPRLLGLKLAAPERLDSVHRRVLPGIPLERVKLVPFPHDFDSSTVQFCRVKPGDEWAWAHAARAIAYDATGRPRHKSFLYCPNVRG
jgi:type VI secretion system protein ImpJ